MVSKFKDFKRNHALIESNEQQFFVELSALPNKLSNPKKKPSGSLYSFIQNKKNKSGQVLTYPKVESKRDHNNERHWFWAYCWDEKTEDGWKSRKRSVSVEKLAIVRKAIADNKPIEKILKLI